MEKEIVSYDQALALKELDYDDTPWFGNQASLYNINGEHTMYTNYGMMYSGLSDGYISAPLKQQVFRWFREKYNYDISVRGASFRANWVISVPLLINNDSKDGYSLVISWDYKTSDGMKVLTYEEAENACIDKLIEIVKNQIS